MVTNVDTNLKKDNFPFVDVIITNFNKSLFLEEAILSVIKQTYKNWKLYIIDDNSTDNSIQIINKFSGLKNTSIIKLSKNSNPPMTVSFFGGINSSNLLISLILHFRIL